jgi:putative tryptophan/tyrosine transport system substrate-binding protein
VRLKVNVIVAVGAEVVVAAKQAPSTIPIIIAGAADPIGQNIVASLARPGGNITGVSFQLADIATKRLELTREAVPGLRRLAIMGNPSASILEISEAQKAARTLGLETLTFEIRQGEDIAPAFEILREHEEALYVCSSAGVITPNRTLINKLALRARLPTMHAYRVHVEAGGLMSYGPNAVDLFRRTAEYVHKILRGEPPGEIPIEQPTESELVINLKPRRSRSCSRRRRPGQPSAGLNGVHI